MKSILMSLWSPFVQSQPRRTKLELIVLRLTAEISAYDTLGKRERKLRWQKTPEARAEHKRIEKDLTASRQRLLSSRAIAEQLIGKQGGAA